MDRLPSGSVFVSPLAQFSMSPDTKSDHVAESCRYLLMANHDMRYTFQG